MGFTVGGCVLGVAFVFVVALRFVCFRGAEVAVQHFIAEIGGGALHFVERGLDRSKHSGGVFCAEKKNEHQHNNEQLAAAGGDEGCDGVGHNVNS